MKRIFLMMCLVMSVIAARGQFTHNLMNGAHGASGPVIVSMNNAVNWIAAPAGGSSPMSTNVTAYNTVTATLLLVGVTLYDADDYGDPTYTIHDSQGNTYTLAAREATGLGEPPTAIYYCYGPSNSATMTTTVTASIGCDGHMTVQTLALKNTVGTHVDQTSFYGSNTYSTAITPTANNAFVLVILNSYSGTYYATPVVASPYTMDYYYVTSSPPTGAAFAHYIQSTAASTGAYFSNVYGGGISVLTVDFY
jgi:hypothetical protein